MTNKTNKTKVFIRKFNFPSPDWNSLPEGFPNCDTSGLSAHEQGLFDGILLAYYNEHGRNIVYKKAIKLTLSIAFVITAGFVVKDFFDSSAIAAVKSVSAATVSAALKSFAVQVEGGRVNEIIESTMSGILR